MHTVSHSFRLNCIKSQSYFPLHPVTLFHCLSYNFKSSRLWSTELTRTPWLVTRENICWLLFDHCSPRLQCTAFAGNGESQAPRAVFYSPPQVPMECSWTAHGLHEHYEQSMSSPWALHEHSMSTPWALHEHYEQSMSSPWEPVGDCKIQHTCLLHRSNNGGKYVV